MSSELLSSSTPKYLEIAGELRRDIESGVFRAGDRLPTFVELRERFATTAATIDRAHAVLERDGLIERGRGWRGTQVAARRTRSTRHVIGCLGFNFQMPGPYRYRTHLLGGMQRVAEDEGYEVLLTNHKAPVSWEKMDGAIFHGLDTRKHVFVPAVPHGMPIVSLMCAVEGLTSVVADDFEGGRLATEHLLQLGHQRIGALMFLDSMLPQIRLNGYRAALHVAGLAADPKWLRQIIPHQADSLRGAARASMAQWLREDWTHNGVTAVLAQNDEVAVGIVDAVLAAGLRVPHDVSVIGFDGTDDCVDAVPPLTSVHVPLDSVGAMAMDLLLRQLGGEHVAPHVAVLPTRLDVRGTTARANPAAVPKFPV